MSEKNYAHSLYNELKRNSENTIEKNLINLKETKCQNHSNIE